jgi:hypothetical protein
MIPAPFYLFFLVLAGIILLVFAYGLFTTPTGKQKKTNPVSLKGKQGEAGVCPICGTVLRRGEQINSALFPGEKDRLCHIFGCPHCIPYLEEDTVRTCPVCKKNVPPDQYLIARLFDRPQGKRHVHILGCTDCRLPKKK